MQNTLCLNWLVHSVKIVKRYQAAVQPVWTSLEVAEIDVVIMHRPRDGSVIACLPTKLSDTRDALGSKSGGQPSEATPNGSNTKRKTQNIYFCNNPSCTNTAFYESQLQKKT